MSWVHLISGIKKTQESDPLADFLRFLRRLGSGASGFSYQFSFLPLLGKIMGKMSGTRTSEASLEGGGRVRSCCLGANGAHALEHGNRNLEPGNYTYLPC